MDDRKPWEVESKLTQERLLMMMNVFVRVRRELQPLYTKGDSPWSHGCRAYSWILDGIEQLEIDLKARGERWLRTYRRNNYFLLWVEDVLVRIYRGDPEKPNERSLKLGQQLQGKLPGILGDSEEEEEATADWVWMLSYESTPMPWLAKDMQPNDGLVIAASICQARSAGTVSTPADTRYAWTCPIGTGDVALTAMTDNKSKPFEPGRPSVKPKTSAKRKKKGDNSSNGDGDA